MYPSLAESDTQSTKIQYPILQKNPIKKTNYQQYGTINNDSTAVKPQTCNCTSCLSYLLKIPLFILSYTIIASVISEILLLINVYFKGDYKFFILSLIFLITPLCFVSILVCVLDDNIYKCSICRYMPFINIPFTISYRNVSDKIDYNHSAVTSIFEALLTGTMTFPLYIINLSYLLETKRTYNDISIYNMIQLLFSLINFVKTPSTFFLNTVANVDTFSICDKIKAALSVIFVFSPIVLIEIIHFFPFIFAYYMDRTLNETDLIAIIVIFNVPKLLFVVHILKKLMVQNVKTVKTIGCFLWIISCLIMITVPLVPYMIVVFGKQSSVSGEFLCKDGCCNSTVKYYWNLVLYLFISYGGSCLYVIIRVGFENVSIPVEVSISVLLFLVLFITLTFPCGYTCMKRNRVRINPYIKM